MPKSDVKTFPIEDVVALYLGKELSLGQMKSVRQVVEFLFGGSQDFSFTDMSTMLKIRQNLVQQVTWLGSLRYNREDKDWMSNIIHNHGKTVTLHT